MRAIAGKGKIHANHVICRKLVMWMVFCLPGLNGRVLSLIDSGTAGCGDRELVGTKNA